MLAQAITIGRQHRLMNHNCQDFALTHSPAPGYFYGLVLDGCGGKYRETAETEARAKFKTYSTQSEVGARLLGQFLGQWLDRHLVCQELLDCLPDKLQLASERFLETVVDGMGFVDLKEKQRFVCTNLLATVIGFVITPSRACFFWAGDGYLFYNGELTDLDCNNQPPYLAYNLIRKGGAGQGKLVSLQSRQMPVTNEPRWVAVATDGWQAEQLKQLERPQSGLDLQRLVNVEARQRGRFEDDGAIAMWVRDVG